MRVENWESKLEKVIQETINKILVKKTEIATNKIP